MSAIISHPRLQIEGCQSNFSNFIKKNSSVSEFCEPPDLRSSALPYTKDFNF